MLDGRRQGALRDVGQAAGAAHREVPVQQALAAPRRRRQEGAADSCQVQQGVVAELGDLRVPPSGFVQE